MNKIEVQNINLSQISPQTNDVAVMLRANGTVDVISYLEPEFTNLPESEILIKNVLLSAALVEALQNKEFVEELIDAGRKTEHKGVIVH